jgi:Na+-translocating ferredoxin:NAD+ oxidoreductase RnfC subunit
VDATHSPDVEAGQRVQEGQKLSEDAASMAPLSGVVQSVRFDGEAHAFVIVIVPDDAS